MLEASDLMFVSMLSRSHSSSFFPFTVMSTCRAFNVSGSAMSPLQYPLRDLLDAVLLRHDAGGVELAEVVPEAAAVRVHVHQLRQLRLGDAGAAALPDRIEHELGLLGVQLLPPARDDALRRGHLHRRRRGTPLRREHAVVTLVLDEAVGAKLAHVVAEAAAAFLHAQVERQLLA